MTAIVVGTTPTIVYNFKSVAPSDITTAVLTIKKAGSIVLTKDLTDAEVAESSISWTLTQSETLAIGIGDAEMMLNWVTNQGVRGIGKKEMVTFIRNHITEVMT